MHQSINKPLVQVKNLNKSFGDVEALIDVSLAISAGEIVALLGANGAGKTSLINHLLGRLRPSSGEVWINGNKPGSMAARQSIGAILQATQMPGTLTVQEHLTLFRSYYTSPIPLNQALATAGLTDLVDRRFDTLSGGQKQRLFFAMAICGRPDIVLLDEPTVGLDAESRRDFWTCIRTLRSQGTTVLLTTHYLEEADALADRILLLAEGSLMHEGTPESIKQQLGGKRIRFRTTANTAHIGELLPGHTVTEYGDYIDVIAPDEVATLKVLLSAPLDVRDLSVEPVSLESALMHLSQKFAGNQKPAAAPVQESEQQSEQETTKEAAR
ncbi:ABC transporter ATP-binding protein [Gilvimarinus sp. SDUM040013]|uniref:ABC transporter ATP-binding protein n=1 Tax=Gilvimarinus gilvus TaxID=3058038 RepID=A0ABU4S0E7_9GAMM|nr:ABC transporter ATP-binding protein [Gilvimarinus sp. SDUM040013]MDO3385808.1 ABC transporter ATP-binding protein [Gilvimarinus sp. SDUM040013]MDX6850630.1 ABC transporter ATP-binding protein [Gilvimarinus sp. SDUM040013]